MRLKIIAFNLLFALSATVAAAQTYIFKNYEIADGLPSNTVLCSIQDRRGFMWFGTKDGICRYDGNLFKNFGDEPSQTAMNGMTRSLCEDANGMIWFSNTNVVGYYNPETAEVVTVIPHTPDLYRLVSDKEGCVWVLGQKETIRYSSSYKPENIQNGITFTEACTDDSGEFWGIRETGELVRYNYDSHRFETVVPSLVSDTERIIKIASAGHRMGILATNEGRIYKYDSVTGKTELILSKGLESVSINCLLTRAPGEYWIGTLQGLYVINYQGLTGPITYESRYSLQDGNVISMSSDRNGNVWLGTFHRGLSLWFNRSHHVSQFIQGTSTNMMAGRMVRTIAEDRFHDIWVGTEDGFLNIFHPEARTVEVVNRSSGLGDHPNFHGMLEDNGRMWLATFNQGIYLMDEKTHRVIRHYSLANDECCCLHRTGDGRLLAGTSIGLYEYDPTADRFNEAEGFSGLWIHSIFEDSFRTLWVGTYGDGLYRIQSGDTLHIRCNDPEYGLKSNHLVSFFEDRSGKLWIATEGAGICYTPTGTKPSFKHFARTEGLPSNVACAISQDSNDMLWISTTKGLVQFNPDNFSIESIYNDANGSTGNNYSYCACYRSAAGGIHLGTSRGLMKFDPEVLAKETPDAPLYIVEIASGNEGRTVQLHEPGKSTIMTDKVRIKSRDASHISISFAALDFPDVSDFIYEYTLKGRGNDIRTSTRENSVIFTGMRPGKYRFNVRLAGSTAEEASKELAIAIVPPFFGSAAAYIIYFLIVIALIVSLYLMRKKKMKEEEMLELEKLEAAKQREIAEAKVNFFTNITHEIRTPLTLIKLPVDKLVNEGAVSGPEKDDLMTIQSNTNRLLNLTNQLLDIRKMENREYITKPSDFDLTSYLHKVCGYFTSGIKERHIDYTEDIPASPVKISCDADFLEKILCNLLSNAVKYSSGRINVKLHHDTERNLAIISVNTSGDLLSPEDAEKIFEPFYQVRTVNSQLKGSNGTGLGLPHAKSLATALGGSLFYDTDRRDCNSFVLELPLTAETATSSQAETIKEEKSIQTEGNRHWVLVVEDSREMNEYLCKQLEPDYNVLSAVNGEEAVEIIRNNKVDLVVSDIMMPVMNGCELCNFVKKNLEYSHIPVILLTAAVGVETRIQTLEIGADGYIEKPFSMELLKANIANLFKNKEIAYNQFANSPLSHYSGTVINTIDQEFMDSLHDAVMSNIADQDLDIERLTRILHTSKSTLYRKVKANTGVNINEYIRICRLKKAAEMLSTQKYRINEVAYLTGFSSPSYFATSFQKQFQISPSNFLKNLTK